jgi:type VI secretion system secreted protein VgrG
LDGTLTLDATGDPNAQFVFQLAYALTTGSTSLVSVIGGNSNTEVYWVVGSQATLGSGSTFAGNILAGTSVVFDSTAQIECGRAFARTASVTMIDNLVSDTCAAQGLGTLPSDFGSLGFSGGAGAAQGVPEPGTLTLLAIGLGVGLPWLRKFRRIRQAGR